MRIPVWIIKKQQKIIFLSISNQKYKHVKELSLLFRECILFLSYFNTKSD